MAEGKHSRKDLMRAASMADAAPVLSYTPRGQLDSAFQDSDAGFDQLASSVGGGRAPTARGAAGTVGSSSSNSRKPGR